MNTSLSDSASRIVLSVFGHNYTNISILQNQKNVKCS